MTDKRDEDLVVVVMMASDMGTVLLEKILLSKAAIVGCTSPIGNPMDQKEVHLTA